jgi:hypothetical protein
MLAFWVGVPYAPLVLLLYQRFGGTYFQHLQREFLNQQKNYQKLKKTLIHLL